MVDPPIQITAVDVPAANSANPLTITWTGAAPNSVVKASLVYRNFSDDLADYGYVPAGAGTFTFQPICVGNPAPMGSGRYCSFGLPEVTEVVVKQMPLTAQIPTFQASGVTGGIQIQWSYRYVFGVPAP
jgi:hypothetical protein